jgi:hypothetical protein
MAFRKQMALAMALAFSSICFGCADDTTAPNTEDEQPVLPPTNVRALALSDGHVQVLWDASSQPTINGYNLYRRDGGHGNPKRLNSTRILATQYIDGTTVEQRQYEYRLTAVNSEGKESRFTAVVIQVHAAVGNGPGRDPARDTQ